MGESDTKPSASPEAKRILQGLSSRHIGERLAMEQELKQMGPEAAELLLQLLGEEAQNKRQRRRIFWIALGGGLSAAALVALALFVGGHPELMGIVGAFGGLGGLSALMVPTQRYYIIINTLSQLDDVRATGPLAEALSLPDLNIRTAVARTLMRLLPRLQPTDAEWFNTEQRAALHRVLQTSNAAKETEFMLVIMQALITIEDIRALPILESLAEDTVPDILQEPAAMANMRRVQEAARQGALLLKTARDRLEGNHTLLRPSISTTAPEQLLRAAQSAPETPPQQLLRSISSGNESE